MHALVGFHLLTEGGNACVRDERRVERVLRLPGSRCGVSAAHRTHQVLEGRVRTQSSGLPVTKELDVDRLARNARPKRSEVLRSGRRMAPVHGTYMNIQFS